MSKKAKIALVNPPTLKGVFRHKLYLPIGLAYLAAVLEDNGHEVTVIDCPATEADHKKLRAKLASFEPLMRARAQGMYMELRLSPSTMTP